MKDQIVVLHGPDRVRKRPAVVFGSADARGALQALKMLMNVFAREAVAGFCKYMSVTLYADGSVGIYSADRGMKLDETLENGNPVWQNVFCELPVFPRYPSEDREAFSRRQDLLYGDGSVCPAFFPDADYAVDLCCVQCVCEYMTVESVRDGIQKSARFEKGFPVAPLHTQQAEKPSGTYIRLQFDSAVFCDARLNPGEVSAFLHTLPQTYDNLQCDLFVEKTDF